MTETEDSFGRLVVRRAWFEAWAFFESWRRDLAVFVFSTIVGGAAFYGLHGWPEAWSQAVDAVVLVAAPAVVLWLLLFVWHLWLAPSALAYEAARQALGEAKPSPPKQPPTVNWAVWKQRSSYNLIELASILAKLDPGGPQDTTDEHNFLKLLQEAAMSGALKVTRDRLADTSFQPDIWPAYFGVAKAEAIKWAKAKGFDLFHVT